MKQYLPMQWHMGDKVFEAYQIKHLVTSNTHWHSHFLVSLYTEGKGIQVVNGIEYPVSKGCITLLTPFDFHSNIIEKGESASVYTVKISGKVFYEAIGDYCSLEDFPIIQVLSDDEFKSAEFLFSMLLKEQENSSSLGSEQFAECLIVQLVILALRSNDKTRKVIKSRFLRDALIYIHYNFKNNIHVSDVARHVGYSTNYFCTEFKKASGVSFRSYLSDIRLDFAMNLLRLSNLSVTEICLESGFSTLTHFSKAFKQRYGASPEKFKKGKKEICQSGKVE